MDHIAAAFAWALNICAIAGSVICIPSAACRLRKMQPGRTTKWAWLGVYSLVFVLAWVALAKTITATATGFEQACIMVAAAYLLLTIPSWRTVPAVCRINYGRRSTDRPGEHIASDTSDDTHATHA